MKIYSGEIKLIEYNVRLGDSEAVNILGLLDSSLIDYLDNPFKNPNPGTKEKPRGQKKTKDEMKTDFIGLIKQALTK